MYYGLHSAFAFGQVVFGLFGLFLAWRAAGLLRETPVLLLSLAAGIAWLELTLLFMTYWQPKVNVVVFCALIVVALVTRTRT